MEILTIEDRKNVQIQGATKVLSATNTQAVVEVQNCNLVISGKDIEVTKLDLENKVVQFSGEIISIKYSTKTEKTNLFKRIFK